MITNPEQDIQLLNDILNRNYYYYFKNNDNNRRIILQFFPNSQYDNSQIIPKYQSPKADKKIILNNLKILLNWYNFNNFKCNIQIDDEFWLQDFIFRKEVFNILYNNLNNINIYITNTFNNLFEKDFSFLNQQIIKFKEKNIKIIYTALVEDIYNIDLINFINYNSLITKIKISPNSIQNLQQDYLYIIKKYENEENIIFYEEESQEWTEDKIQLFLNFIDFYFDYKIKNNQKQELIDNIFLNDNFIFSLSNKGTLDESNPYGKCKLYHNLNIALYNLGINFCKKFQYDDLTIGYYQIENNKITKCIPNNLPAAMVPAHTKRYILPKCEYCHYLNICNGYCHGDAYKTVLNPLIPLYETCNLKKAKFTYILYKIKQLKLLDITQLEVSKLFKDHLLYLYENINQFLGGQ